MPNQNHPPLSEYRAYPTPPRSLRCLLRVPSWRAVGLLLMLGGLAAHAQSPTWNVFYDPDPFSDKALLDLRYLNEKTAGENGFIQRSADGRGFVTAANQRPIRFWATNGGDMTKNMTDAQLAQYARFMAKVGVNMIRYHGGIFPKKTDSQLTDVDMDEVNNIWRVVAAMKKEGIYTVISPFWAGFMNTIPEGWGLGEYRGQVQPWALMYFNDKFRDAYKKWVEVLYTRPNPYTGIPLKDEPAVALIQVKNEDSVLFWTIQGVKGDLKERIETLFFQWAVKKYGTAQAALAAWSNAATPTDNLTTGRFGIYLIYDATIPQTGGKNVRVGDMVQFLTEHQRAFYADIVAHYRALGCRQLTNASNWKTASSNALNDAERWSNDVTDVLAVNRYYDPQHVGDNSGWRIDPGHHYVGTSALFRPEQLPVNVKQPHDKPFFVTESGWNLPNRFQAEGPFLVSAYLSLTGVDGFFWFQPSTAGLDPFPYFDFTNLEGGQKAMSRWTASVPGQILMLPANALLYRKGYIAEGTPVATEDRTLTSLWARKTPLISEENSFDPNRDTWDNAGTATQTELPPIAYLAGPVRVKYDAPADAKTVAPNLGTLVNLRDKVVTSTTGQLRWDYKNGVCTMNAPSAQGVAGFLKTASPTTQLADLTIASDNEYAAINVVAMDDKPLKTSERVLVQVGTTYRPFQWSETPATFKIGNEDVRGFRILNTGKMPWLAVNTSVTLTLTNAAIRSAYLLDLHGVPASEIFVERRDGKAVIRLPENAMYVVLSTNAPTITGLEKKSDLLIYPNPAEGELVVQLPEADDFGNHIRLIDARGQVVRTFENRSGGRQVLSTRGLASGLYVVELQEPGGTARRVKVVVR